MEGCASLARSPPDFFDLPFFVGHCVSHRCAGFPAIVRKLISADPKQIITIGMSSGAISSSGWQAKCV
jgi:hypothetical protein